MASIGTHCLLELYGCPHEILDDHDLIVRTLRDAAEAAGATWLSHTSYKFSPQGVTAVGLLSESHISIHTWPESGYAAADVFTCGDIAMPEKACEYLCRELGCTHFHMTRLGRADNIGCTPQIVATHPFETRPLDAAMAPT